MTLGRAVQAMVHPGTPVARSVKTWHCRTFRILLYIDPVLGMSSMVQTPNAAVPGASSPWRAWQQLQAVASQSRLVLSPPVLLSQPWVSSPQPATQLSVFALQL